jgi:hypothetical protein
MTLVGFHPGARAEFRESICYYETQQPKLGKRFLSAVRSATERIELHPLMYKALENDIRQCRVRHFPYGLIYRLSSPDGLLPKLFFQNCPDPLRIIFGVKNSPKTGPR